MYKIKTALIIAFIMVPWLHYGQYTDQINSNRPGETMSAFSVGKSVFQIETGFYGIKEKHSLLNYEAQGYGADMTLRWGLFFENLELITDLQYQNEDFTQGIIVKNKTALKQTVLGAKYLIYDPFKNYEEKIDLYSWKANNRFKWRQLVPAVSLFAGANLTFSDNPYHFSPEASISPKIMLITQNHLGDKKWVLVGNFIADYISTEYPSYGYVLTLTRGLGNKWSAFIENQGYKSDFYSDAIIRGGAAFLVYKNMQIDASISSSLKNTPSILYGGVGLSWRYDANYSEVKMKIDSGDSKKALRRARKTKKG